ncbi:DUF4267 domain-containing protein [Streptomyces sp. SID6673]|nr:DUF4267 domain-containing protein [Streptomyces sp. SID11726]NEB24738.1 DUF4267 domain-containing protein [Streptomyces sp. SID6673]
MLTSSIGLVLSWIGGLGIVAIGAAYLAKNEKNAAGFGLPVLPASDARGWWQVKGIRDVTSGLLVIVFTFAARDQLALLVLVLALIPLGDMWIVLSNEGDRKAALGIHGATALAMIVAAVLLFV